MWSVDWRVPATVPRNATTFSKSLSFDRLVSHKDEVAGIVLVPTAIFLRLLCVRRSIHYALRPRPLYTHASSLGIALPLTLRERRHQKEDTDIFGQYEPIQSNISVLLFHS